MPITRVIYIIMNELEDIDADDEEVVLPSEQILIDLISAGKTLPEAALEAFPFKDDPVRFAAFRLRKRDLYRSLVLAYGDERFSDFAIVDKYTTILNDDANDAPIFLKALKDYHEFRKSFTHEPKADIHIVEGTGTVNQQIVNNFFDKPSPSDTISSVLIPKEQIYANEKNRVLRQDTGQLNSREREGDVGLSSEADQE